MSEIISSLLEYFFATSESIFEISQRYEIPSPFASIPQYLFSIPLRSTLNDKRAKKHRPPFPSKVNETKAGSQPVQYGLGAMGRWHVHYSKGLNCLLSIF